jgi:hypothetical protein
METLCEDILEVATGAIGRVGVKSHNFAAQLGVSATGTVAVHLVPEFGSCTPNTISITTNLRILSHVQ